MVENSDAFALGVCGEFPFTVLVSTLGIRALRRQTPDAQRTPRRHVAPMEGDGGGAWRDGWFIDGFGTLDLKEAKKLLDELAA